VQRTGALPASGLRGSPARRRKEAVIRNVFRAAAILSILISALIILSLVGEAAGFLRNVELSSLWSEGWFPRSNEFDIKTLVVGTMLVTGIGMLVAAPLGLGAAIYLAEYARARLRRWLKPILEILAGIPSVVLGFFALTWIGPHLVAPLCGGSSIFTITAAGLGVGILVTPLVASVAEDALRAVPMSLREAAYGLGAKKRTTTRKVVLPAAVSGVVASLILGASRAIGETMVVAIAAGATGQSLFTYNVCKPGQTMTAAMASLAVGSDQVSGSTDAFQSLFFVGLVLFLFTLALNIISDRFVKKVRVTY
jgi:phosphate transport system permease protein